MTKQSFAAQTGERLGVVADDLTGAMETGAELRRFGLSTRLILEEHTFEDDEPDVEVLTTDSRGVRRAEAIERARSAVFRLAANGRREIYKKIDSTLRGNVASETVAMLGCLPEGTVGLICPAYPFAGRRVVGGHLLVGADLVSQSHAREDLVSPVVTSNVVELMKGERIEVADIGSDVVAAGEARLSETLLELSDRGVRVLVLDAVTDHDLSVIARASRVLAPRPLCVGSVGLARALAPVWLEGAAKTGRSGPVLVVVASLRDATRSQLEHLVRIGDMPMITLESSGCEQEIRVKAFGELQTTKDRALLSGGLILATGRTVGDVSGDALVRILAEVAKRAADVARPSGIVVSGGDAASAVLRECGVRGIEIEGEVARGVPRGQAIGGLWPNLPIATKSGGFGEVDALTRAVELIKYERKM